MAAASGPDDALTGDLSFSGSPGAQQLGRCLPRKPLMSPTIRIYSCQVVRSLTLRIEMLLSLVNGEVISNSYSFEGKRKQVDFGLVFSK